MVKTKQSDIQKNHQFTLKYKFIHHCHQATETTYTSEKLPTNYFESISAYHQPVQEDDYGQGNLDISHHQKVHHISNKDIYGNTNVNHYETPESVEHNVNLYEPKMKYPGPVIHAEPLDTDDYGHTNLDTDQQKTPEHLSNPHNKKFHHSEDKYKNPRKYQESFGHSSPNNFHNKDLDSSNHHKIGHAEHQPVKHPEPNQYAEPSKQYNKPVHHKEPEHYHQIEPVHHHEKPSHSLTHHGPNKYSGPINHNMPDHFHEPRYHGEHSHGTTPSHHHAKPTKTYSETVHHNEPNDYRNVQPASKYSGQKKPEKKYHEPVHHKEVINEHQHEPVTKYSGPVHHNKPIHHQVKPVDPYLEPVTKYPDPTHQNKPAESYVKPVKKYTDPKHHEKPHVHHDTRHPDHHALTEHQLYEPKSKYPGPKMSHSVNHHQKPQDSYNIPMSHGSPKHHTVHHAPEPDNHHHHETEIHLAPEKKYPGPQKHSSSIYHPETQKPHQITHIQNHRPPHHVNDPKPDYKPHQTKVVSQEPHHEIHDHHIPHQESKLHPVATYLQEDNPHHVLEPKPDYKPHTTKVVHQEENPASGYHQEAHDPHHNPTTHESHEHHTPHHVPKPKLDYKPHATKNIHQEVHPASGYHPDVPVPHHNPIPHESHEHHTPHYEPKPKPDYESHINKIIHKEVQAPHHNPIPHEIQIHEQHTHHVPDPKQHQTSRQSHIVNHSNSIVEKPIEHHEDTIYSQKPLPHHSGPDYHIEKEAVPSNNHQGHHGPIHANDQHHHIEDHSGPLKPSHDSYHDSNHDSHDQQGHHGPIHAHDQHHHIEDHSGRLKPSHDSQEQHLPHHDNPG